MVNNNNCKIVCITGGVISSLGKGLATAALGSLLQQKGFKIKLKKLDPYLNVDPGTMNPVQHGEVFVTEDGGETDLDLGHYERFVGINCSKNDNITTGKIYQKLIMKERKGGYLGETVQVIPHVTDIIKDFILSDIEDYDFLLCEIGGTIGDIESQPFIEAIRQLMYSSRKIRKNIALMHLTMVPTINNDKEFKTKPTQHSVKSLNSMGIQPDIIMCRSPSSIPKDKLEKIASLCSVDKDFVICAPDVKYIYEIPVVYHNFGLDKQILKYFDMEDCFKQSENNPLIINKWENIIEKFYSVKHYTVKIALIGKYVELSDSYKSVLEALDHAGLINNCNVKVELINSEDLSSYEYTQKTLKCFDIVIVPGGFGSRGIKGKLLAIRYAREFKIPFLGICLGFQLSIIEICQNVLKMKDVGSSEFGSYENEVIVLMDSWTSKKDLKKEYRTSSCDKGGTMRLGSYKCLLVPDTKISEIYGKVNFILERHRHRFEFNIKYQSILEEKAGVIFSGICDNRDDILEVIELSNHPWFIATQYHPEFKSRPFNCHPLFASVIAKSLQIKEENSKKSVGSGSINIINQNQTTH
ncbi:CTP synthase [Anaplasmataceae bacterium AB001_6]|nr:CTP synthase [Anaplasmataceae bacterium AB001_6]